VIAEQLPADAVVLPDLVPADSTGIAELPPFAALEHPVAAYLSSIAESSRRVQRSALDAIARRATSVYSVETMPWHRLRRPHVLRIRQLLEDAYEPATANRMLSALRGVLKECWHARLVSADDYQSAIDVPPVRGESEMRGRDLSPGELRALMEACARAPRDVRHRQDAGVRRRRDAALVALVYGAGLRRSEAVALDLADVDHEPGLLRVRRGKGRKPRLAPLAESARPALEDWLQARGREPGPLFTAVRKNGALVRDPDGQLHRLSASAVWAIAGERGRKAGVQPPAPHDFRRTWTGDLLDAGVDLSTVQKMAGHASPATTARYDRRGRATQRRAAAQLHVPYVPPED
jgi:integrase/recombinase XerD